MAIETRKTSRFVLDDRQVLVFSSVQASISGVSSVVSNNYDGQWFPSPRFLSMTIMWHLHVFLLCFFSTFWILHSCLFLSSINSLFDLKIDFLSHKPIIDFLTSTKIESLMHFQHFFDHIFSFIHQDCISNSSK